VVQHVATVMRCMRHCTAKHVLCAMPMLSLYLFLKHTHTHCSYLYVVPFICFLPLLLNPPCLSLFLFSLSLFLLPPCVDSHALTALPLNNRQLNGWPSWSCLMMPCFC
jgi:hypothetical protein